jgi:hypothetical protein
VSRRASISGIADQADVTRPFCPWRLSARHYSISPVAWSSLPGDRRRIGATAVSRPRPPGAAPAPSTGITEVLATGWNIAPGRRFPRWHERQWCFHAWRPRGYPVGSLHRPCLEPCLGRARRECSRQPFRQNNPLGREHRNFSLKRASGRACCWISPATNCPRAGSEPGQGWGPGSTVSPPRRPGLRSA